MLSFKGLLDLKDRFGSDCKRLKVPASMLRSLTSRHAAWSIAVFASSEPTLDPTGKPIFLLDTRKLLRMPWHVRVRADPFLYVHDDVLYLFYESQIGDRPGTIEVRRTRDLINWEELGPLLQEPFHVSYPQIVKVGEAVYLMPETSGSGELRLYRFEDFPHPPVLMRVLLKESVKDPTPFTHDGSWYVLGTVDDTLRLFVSDDLVDGTLRRHSCGIIERRRDYRRCGGAVIQRDGKLFRLAQNHRERYGDNLSLFEITALTPTVYSERLVRDRLVDPRHRWNRDGSHHLSSIRFRDQWITAIDGQIADYYHHKFTGRVGVVGDTLLNAIGSGSR